MAPWQGWLLLAAAGACAAWLFLLKLRPPRMLVSSLLLWRRVLDESRELTLWERIRRAVSLVLDDCDCAGAGARRHPAVARPRQGRRLARTAPDRHRLVVVDAGPDRRRGNAVGTRRRGGAPADGRLRVEVAVATTADGLVEGPTTDRALIDTTLDRLSRPAVTRRPGRAADGDAVHFITDGAIARLLDAGVIVHSVFEPAANVAITAFDVRPSLSSGQRRRRVPRGRELCSPTQRVRVTLTRGAASVFDRSFDMASGEALRQIIPLARGPEPSLTAQVAAPANALEIDDKAFAWIDRARPLPVTIVGSSHGLAAPAARSRSRCRRDVRRSVRLSPRSGRSPGERRAHLRSLGPAEAPDRPALYFAPPPGTPWLAFAWDLAPGAGPAARRWSGSRVGRPGLASRRPQRRSADVVGRESARLRLGHPHSRCPVRTRHSPRVHQGILRPNRSLRAWSS